MVVLDTAVFSGGPLLLLDAQSESSKSILLGIPCRSSQQQTLQLKHRSSPNLDWSILHLRILAMATTLGISPLDGDDTDVDQPALSILDSH